MFIARELGDPIPVFVNFTSPLSALRVCLMLLHSFVMYSLTNIGRECSGRACFQWKYNIGSVL